LSSVVSGQPVRAAVFADIAQVAVEENHRIFGPPPIPADIERMREEAAQEARDLVSMALQQSERIREEAQREGYESGYAHGHQQGLDDARQEVEQYKAALRTEIDTMLRAVEAERIARWQTSEAEITELVLEIAQKVLKDECAVNREAAVSVVKHCLRRVTDTEQVRVRVSAADLPTLRGIRDELTTMLDGLHHLEIVEDRRVQPGGAVVDSRAGSIDARIDTQFEDIAQQVRTLSGVQSQLESEAA
jgi:flagellar assembly protein FliH